MAAGRAQLIFCCLALIAVPGCSREADEGAPVACRQGEEAVRKALESAPRNVSMDGTLLSECLDDTTSAGELQEVGAAYLGVAADLAADASRNPEGRGATQLGFLVGALRRSAAGAQGVGAELQRRIEQELSVVDTRSRAFRRGVAAGRRAG
ncbi:MAG TPA: hypothetical protein VFD31_11650 [Thermoleophilaceae bacterium]|nr:hypothetical protein [Thermoleophilaceae bacterium]